MKNVFYGLCLVPLLGYAGGDILPVDLNYNENESINVKVEPVVEVVPQITVEEVVAKKPSYYIGLAIAATEVDGQSSSVILKNGHPIAVVGKLGYNISENIALEGRVGTGIKKDTISFATSEVDSIAGAYLKPNVNVIENVNLFGLVGYANAKQKLLNETIKTNGFSYGAGLGYQVNNSWEVVADVVRYGKKNSNSIDAYSLGLDYHF